MILNNFYQILANACGLSYSNINVTSIENGKPSLNASGYEALGKALQNSGRLINYPGADTSTTTGTCIVLSTDTTEPERTDYAMDQVLIYGTDLEASNMSKGNSDSIFANYSITVKNIKPEDITVYKVGLMLVFNSGTSGTKNYSTLVYEELLENPVTLKPDDVYTFTVQIG